MPNLQSPDPHGSKVPIRPRPEVVLASARRLWRDGKVAWTTHTDFERMPERDFDVFDVEAVIMKGYVPEPIRQGRKPGEWSIKIVDVLEGTSRKMGVVCVVAKDRLLIIVTTEWEDK